MKDANEMTQLGPDADESQKRLEAAIHAQLGAIAKRHEDKVLQGVAEMVSRYEQPTSPEVVNAKGETVHRMSSPFSPLYRKMDPEIQKLRNPDVDHWGREWIVGKTNNDVARMAQAHAELNRLDPMRADTLEGVADAAGGFADGTGAELLPRILENIVAISRDRVAKMARFATTYAMTAQEHNIPTAAAMQGFMVGEGTSGTTQGEPTFAQVPLIARVAVVKAVASREILEDAAINVVSIFTQRAGAELGALEDEQFFRDGDGSAPNVTKISGTAYTGETTAGTHTYTDMVAMYSALQQEYRQGAVWFMSSSVLQALSNVRDGFGRPLYESLLTAPTVIGDDGPSAAGTLFGKMVYETVMTTGDMWFGDPAAAYAIGRRRGITVEMSRDFYFDTRRVIWLISQRIAGNNVDTAAAQYATGATTFTSL